MSINQMHGKNFEDMIKSTFRGSADSGRRNTSPFDIEGVFDKELHLNTSIKTTKLSLRNAEVFSMSDARRIFSLNEDFRMLIGLYEQRDQRKTFVKVLEYIVKKEDLEKLRGEVTLEMVEKFHEKLKSFPEGKHKEARIYHKKENAKMKDKTLITLNPKIDSKNQRRLQCSFKRKVLESILPPEQIKVYDEEYKDLLLPITIKSGQREFTKK